MKRFIAAAVGLGATALFVATLWSMAPAPQPDTVTAAIPSPLAQPGPPKRLAIPGIGLDAPVQQAGLTADRRMAAPTNYTDVAWYKYGPLPGSPGSAVIAGHLGNGVAVSGIFKNLDQLKPGDDITVTTESGGTLHFVVERLETYPYDQVPPTIFTDKDQARLNLITCAGLRIHHASLGWTYDHRLIVYAVLRS